MHEHGDGATLATLDCCPPLVDCERCETLDIRYRLPFRPTGQLVAGAGRELSRPRPHRHPERTGLAKLHVQGLRGRELDVFERCDGQLLMSAVGEGASK